MVWLLSPSDWLKVVLVYAGDAVELSHSSVTLPLPQLANHWLFAVDWLTVAEKVTIDSAVVFETGEVGNSPEIEGAVAATDTVTFENEDVVALL